MKRYASVLLILVLVLTTVGFSTLTFAATTNQYPIVLVHGMAGWGRDEMNGTYYWGGENGDIQADLIAQGYECYTASVGPISSVWDRACELYAQLVGTTVDYGQAHSAMYGHSRYGKVYTQPLYSGWGSLDAAGKIKKIHLLSHSMGGQTARALVQLLATGSAAERTATPTGISSLFTGGKANWVSSVTTISTPHDGTSLLYGISGIMPLVQDIITFVAAYTGSQDNPSYDFDWGQWGLQRQSGESWASYLDRICDSNVWNSNDTALYDESPTGSYYVNGWVHAQPQVYYFSWVTERTHYCPLLNEHEPDSDMTSTIKPFADIMGEYTTFDWWKVPIDYTWWENDGVVNAKSQTGPKVNSTDTIVTYNGTPQIGVWNYMDEIQLDHMQIIGNGAGPVIDFYLEQAGFLRTLTN